MEKNNLYIPPERLLDELGITYPNEIDIEAIAFYCGAIIKYRSLTGCTARIVGNGNNAIITVNSSSPRARQRFSAAHELGHWAFDRGKASFTCQEKIFIKDWSRHNPETRANEYASDLLLPVSIFRPIASEYTTINFDTVKILAKEFCTSLTATAIRLVEHGPYPSLLAYYSDSGREWFFRSSCVPEILWPSKIPESGTYTYDLLKNKEEHELQGEVPAEAWFESRFADNYLIYEHSLRTINNDVLVLLWWKNEQMLLDIDNYEEGGCIN